MRQLMYIVLGALLFSVGCAEPPPPEQKKPAPRRMMKPGDQPGEGKPGGP